MAKDKTAYVCENCGQESPKWIGKCPACGQWNTFKEIKISADTARQTASSAAAKTAHSLLTNKAMRLRDINSKDEVRIDMHDGELNRVLGEIGETYGVPKTAVAIAWILRHPARMQAIAGTMNPVHLREICEATKVTLTHNEWYRLYLASGKYLP